MNKAIVFGLSQDFIKYPVKLIGPKKQICLEGIIDTGAQISSVDLSIIEQLGIEIKNESPKVQFVTSDGTIRTAPRVKLQIIAYDKKITLTPLVFQNFSIPLILGKDFLERLDYSHLYIEQNIRKFSGLYNEIKKFRDKCILIIGCYRTEDGEQKLYGIRDILKELGYEGILLKDYSDIEEQSIEEKINLFGNLAKFVICENSYLSGHIDELNICARNRLVTIIMQEKGRYTTWMQACYPIDFSFIKKVEYTPNSFDREIARAVRMAESLVEKRKYALNKEYKYREEWFKKELSKKG